MTKKILPVGFSDALFDEAEGSYRRVNLALDYLMKSGYRLVKPPLLEFDDGAMGDCFNVVDGESGRNLALRSDITPQISRIVESGFAGQELPLRLCYVGDVLLKKSDELYANRQLTQLGFELVGADFAGYLEAVSLVFEVLRQILAKKMVVEFSLPGFAEILCQKLGFADDLGLLDALKRKNLSHLREIVGEKSQFLAEVMLKNADLSYLSQIIMENAGDREIEAKLLKILEISQFMAKNFAEIEVCFDLFADHGVSYHKDVAFDVFCEGFSYPVARAGGYEIAGLDAVGATIYMNYLPLL